MTDIDQSSDKSIESNIETRIYETTLEIVFDFENALKTKITKIYYHFHKQSIKDKLTTPYLIVIDNGTNKQKFTYKDILLLLKFIPVLKINVSVKEDFNYVDINNKIIIAPKRGSIQGQLIEYYDEYLSMIQMNNANKIDNTIIESFCNIINEVFEISFDKNFVHINELDYHISRKYICNYSKYKNIIMPGNMKEFDDGSIYIGSFIKFDNKICDAEDDISLALIVCCDRCGEINIINYNKKCKCHKCGADIYY